MNNNGNMEEIKYKRIAKGVYIRELYQKYMDTLKLEPDREEYSIFREQVSALERDEILLALRCAYFNTSNLKIMNWARNGRLIEERIGDRIYKNNNYSQEEKVKIIDAVTDDVKTWNPDWYRIETATFQGLYKKSSEIRRKIDEAFCYACHDYSDDIKEGKTPLAEVCNDNTNEQVADDNAEEELGKAKRRNDEAKEAEKRKQKKDKEAGKADTNEDKSIQENEDKKVKRKNAAFIAAVVLAATAGALGTSQIEGCVFDKRLKELGESRIINDIKDTEPNTEKGDEEKIAEAVALLEETKSSASSDAEKKAADDMINVLTRLEDNEENNGTINTLKNTMVVKLVKDAFNSNKAFSDIKVERVGYDDGKIKAATPNGQYTMVVEDDNLKGACERGGKVGLANAILCKELVAGMEFTESGNQTVGTLVIKPLDYPDHGLIKIDGNVITDIDGNVITDDEEPEM